jgi:hypothetical protein
MLCGQQRAAAGALQLCGQLLISHERANSRACRLAHRSFLNAETSSMPHLQLLLLPCMRMAASWTQQRTAAAGAAVGPRLQDSTEQALKHAVGLRRHLCINISTAGYDLRCLAPAIARGCCCTCGQLRATWYVCCARDADSRKHVIE